jgi:hypothetical protein
MPKRNANDCSVRLEQRDLSVKLSEKDKAIRAGQLAEAVESLDAIASAKKAAMAEFTARGKAMSERIYKLSREIRDGITTQPVECERRLNHTKGTSQLVRMDTGEIIETERPMTTEEKQMEMEFDE